jgi:3-hydroxyisobutyrate dehydrogenase-like beta-hydroxyacid dehydrogenase
MNVGFIGLGNMGQAMARNLLKAGHAVTVYNRTRSRAEVLQAEGAHIANTPAQACGGEVLITMLADDRAVEEVLFGGNTLSALIPHAVHVSMSTLSGRSPSAFRKHTSRPDPLMSPPRSSAGPRRPPRPNSSL